MLSDFLNSLTCMRRDEVSDYRSILASWENLDYHVAFTPAITWYGGTCNLFDQKAGPEGKNLIWIIPAGQADYYWLSTLKRDIAHFYETDEMETGSTSPFPGMEAEEFEECILLHSDHLQNDPKNTVLGANVLLIRLSLSSGCSTLLFILLEHQDLCWKNIIEGFKVSLTWLVESGRGMENYYTETDLYRLMKQTPCPEVLPPLYFKGLYNKGKIPEGFRFLYAMLSEPDRDGYDIWLSFSAVYETGWKQPPDRQVSFQT